MSMGDITAKINDRMDLHVRRATVQIFQSVVMMTPVDTGRAKGNWIPSVGAKVTKPRDRLDKSGELTVGEIIATVPEKAGQVVWLCKNVPYIGKLEYGWSKQAPSPPGIVRLAIANFRATFARDLAASIRQIR